MSDPILNIDTTTNTYTLDGKDISTHLAALKVNMEGCTKSVELTYGETDVKLKGVFVEYDQELAPIVCDCGFEISPYNFDIHCLCPNCGRKIYVSGGKVSCRDDVPLFNFRKRKAEMCRLLNEHGDKKLCIKTAAGNMITYESNTWDECRIIGEKTAVIIYNGSEAGFFCMDNVTYIYSCFDNKNSSR